MAERSVELMKGTLDLLILRTLDWKPLHGSAIADRIAQLTNGAFQVKAGSLFPALHRLEQQGSIEGEWTTSPEGRRVRSYNLTASGKKQLAAERREWERVVGAMTQVLEGGEA